MHYTDARTKLLDRSRQAGLGGIRKTSGTKHIVKEMWDGEKGQKEEDEKPSTLRPPPALQETHPMGSTGHRKLQDISVVIANTGNEEEDDDEDQEEEEEDIDDLHDLNEVQHVLTMQTAQCPLRVKSMQSKQPLIGGNTGNDSQNESSSIPGQEPLIDLDPDDDLEGDPHDESYPCQHCERHFSTRQGLERHIHIHAISNQQVQLFKCRYCNKSFGSQVGRRRHERRHDGGPRKRPGFLGGSVSLQNPLVQNDGSSPDCTSPTSHYIAIGAQLPSGPLHNSDMQIKELGPHVDRPFIGDESGESKELHPCKYCNKAFGTHTNMRRHQRRIHERHLLPKGVRRKGMFLQETSVQQQQQPGESPSTSPPPVYVPSADTEDEADGDDYVVDISKNISENLSFYIDGKILSTSSVSSCDVIEVDSRSAALFGLDTVIISPNQISQTLKVDGRTSATKSISQSAAKRRTSTPPLVPNLKVETESTPFSASLTSSPSSSSNLLVGGLFQQATDASAFQREKAVYLSPKLKQLLQTQDIHKSTITLITESHRLASPLSVTSLQGASGRFKRRTASPPSSPQLSPACKADTCKAEAGSSYTFKVSKLESYSESPPGSLLDKDDSDVQNLSGSNAYRRPSSSSGGNACNQQPLDLSNSILRRSDSTNKVLGDSALDLSLHRKSIVEPELKGSPAPQPLIKKRKPNTSMLEKVLMNEYAGLTSPAEEGSSAIASLGCFHSRSSNATSESTHPSPPSLTPVTMNPCSPGSSSMTSPTPPPPVLPTIPSPPAMPRSPLSQPSDSSALRPLPVLSPKMSPRSVAHSPHSDPEEIFDEQFDNAENTIAMPLDPTDTPLKDPQVPTAVPSPSEPVSVGPHTEDVTCALPCSSRLTGKLDQDSDSERTESLCPDLAVSAHLESPSVSSSAPPASHDPPPPVSPSLLHIAIKEEPLDCTDESSLRNHTPEAGVDSSPPSVAADKPCEMAEVDSPYCKSFVCNVCEKPFDSIKELSGHITEHAGDWPFKCEFCVQLFGDAPALLAHRTTLHGVGKIFVCSMCSKEFAFLINLQQHQKDLHPNLKCTHTTIETGKLRPQNYTDPSRAKEESSPSTSAPDSSETNADNISDLTKPEPDVNGNHAEDGSEDPNEELYTTIRIMASEGGKPKGPDVRLGINQHYPSFKPPPFPYHNRSHAGSVASATNFTTHNIPQTFSTAIRCTKCGDSFDNLPELHKHILACASASDKKRYTPKKNPIPLKQIVKCQNGVVPPSASEGQNAFRRMGQPKRLNFNQDLSSKTKLSALNKKKNQLVQKAISQKNKTANTTKKAAVKDEVEQELNVCPHCSREFTYPASLNKHISVSCPMKPAVKKGKKGIVEVKKEAGSVVDKNINLRKKASDSEMQQAEPEPVKPTGKSRARSTGAAEPKPVQTSKTKTNSPGRLKRPASFPPPVPFSKKSKKGQVQSLPPTPSSLDAPSDTAQHPAVKKEAVPKRLAEAKSPPQQLKKDERVSVRARERAGGPVTRSLQMANAVPLAEVKTEEPSIPEPKESQEVLMK